MLKLINLLSIWVLGISFVCAQPDSGEVKLPALSNPIERFSMVAENVYRGAQPDKKGFEYLKEMGIKTVINFRDEEDLAERDKKIVQSLGMTYIHLPWRIYGSYDYDFFLKVLSLIEQKSQGPVFFHCRRGSERTGVIAGIYKIKHEGYSAEKAYEYTKEFDLMTLWKGFVKSKLSKFEEDFSE